MENVVAPVGTFTAEQLQIVSNSLMQAIDNILSSFVALLPLFAIVAGIAFGIQLIYKLFNSLCSSRIDPNKIYYDDYTDEPYVIRNNKKIYSYDFTEDGSDLYL